VTTAAIDWKAWLASWEAQQGRHNPRREERFLVIVQAVRSHCGADPRVLDLGAGPGSLSLRLVEAIPAARVLAIDRDPLLLELGRRALAGEGRIRFVDADLGDPDLIQLGSDFDAAVSTTALHWLRPEPLRQLYRSLAAMLRPGGIFLNGDRLAGGSELDDLASVVRHRLEPEVMDDPADPGTWEGWWRAVEREPGFAAALAERARRDHGHPQMHGQAPSLMIHEAALREAGFREVGALWQHLDDRVLAALR